MPDWGNWSPDLWKMATVSLFLTYSRTNLKAVWWCDIWISRGRQACRLWIMGGLIWALSVLSLFFIPIPSQVFDFVFTSDILQRAKLWWTTCSIASWWGWGMLGGGGGKTPLVLRTLGMKIISCCGGPLACFKYLYILLECWVKNWWVYWSLSRNEMGSFQCGTQSK